ncbi:hypothetical protein [Lysobacter gummosus]|uniref:hypothetical protein n=1 Tax=Lysobacter gummosus TaxID=262324 RepID=UPI003638B255
MQGSRDKEQPNRCAAYATHARQDEAVAFFGDSLHVVCSRRSNRFTAQRLCRAQSDARALVFHVARRAWKRESASAIQPCSTQAPMRAGRAAQGSPAEVERHACRGPRPDAKQGMRRGSCETKDQGCLS